MFSPGRLLTFGIFAFLVYMGFYAVPGGMAGPSDFDPEEVARHEVAAWRAARVREELPTFMSCVLYQRELHRMSWFRAVESGMALSKVLTTLPQMTNRFERSLPQLEQVASIEKTWKEAEFDPARVARSQLNWMITTKNPRQGDNAQRSAGDMADEWGMRFGIQPVFMFPAASDRADAFRQILGQPADPDWDQLTLLLTRSYTTLKTTLARARDANAP